MGLIKHGGQTMNLTVSTGGKFQFIGTFAEKDVAKSAGFRWDPAVKRWWTDDPEKAARLKEIADDAALQRIEEGLAQAGAAREASRATDAEIDIPCPDGLAYMPFQKAGIAYAMARPACLIGDEMGLGKTIQAIGVINADPSLRRILVICPASLKINWQREMSRWLTRDLKICIADSQTPVTQAAYANILISNYDILTKLTYLPEMEWDLIIADEAHYAKNPKAQRTKALHALTARRRLLLTGTPITNRPAELFSLIHYLDPETWPKFMPYAIRYCGARRDRWGWDFSGASNLDELQDRLRATILVRRLKKDVLTELPPKRRQVIELPANGHADLVARETAAWERSREQTERLRAQVELAKAADDEGAYKAAVARLQEQMGVAFAEMSRLRHETAVAKVPQVIEHLKDVLEANGKICLFAHHHDVVDAIAAAFPDISVTLTGRDAQEDRQKAVDAFQADPKVRLFIGSITAAGVGLTLTASSHVVFAELDWVPGNVTQAEDRTHRIGQTNPVLVQHLVLDDSLDAKMAKTIIRKQEVIDAALDDPTSREILAIPILPASDEKQEPATATTTRKALDEAATTITDAQRDAIHACLRSLAGMDPDRARDLNGIGFNRIDGEIGHSLVDAPRLTPRQAALGLRIVKKYHRQLDEGLLAAAKGE